MIYSSIGGRVWIKGKRRRQKVEGKRSKGKVEGQKVEGKSTQSVSPVLAAAAVVAALTFFLTWPQGLYLGTKVAAHNDPYFSTWRLAWIAHALRVDPHHLYDTNIF